MCASIYCFSTCVACQEMMVIVYCFLSVCLLLLTVKGYNGNLITLYFTVG